MAATQKTDYVRLAYAIKAAKRCAAEDGITRYIVTAWDGWVILFHDCSTCGQYVRVDPDGSDHHYRGPEYLGSNYADERTDATMGAWLDGEGA